jgi:MFS family permease
VDLLAIPVFRLSMLTSVAAFGAQTLAAVALPFLLLDGLQRSAGQAGGLLAAGPAGTVLAAPVAGRLIGRVPSGLLGGIGLGLMALGLLALALLPAHPSGAALAWRLAVCGVGFGLFQSPNNHTIVTSAPQHRSGGAAGMLGTARLTGQSLGALVEVHHPIGPIEHEPATGGAVDPTQQPPQRQPPNAAAATAPVGQPGQQQPCRQSDQQARGPGRQGPAHPKR